MNIRKVKLMAVLLTGGMSGLNCSDAAKQTDVAASEDRTGTTSILLHTSLGQAILVDLYPGMPFKEIEGIVHSKLYADSHLFNTKLPSLYISNIDHGRVGTGLDLADRDRCLTSKEIETMKSRPDRTYVKETRKGGR